MWFVRRTATTLFAVDLHCTGPNASLPSQSPRILIVLTGHRYHCSGLDFAADSRNGVFCTADNSGNLSSVANYLFFHLRNRDEASPFRIRCSEAIASFLTAGPLNTGKKLTSDPKSPVQLAKTIFPFPRTFPIEIPTQ